MEVSRWALKAPSCKRGTSTPEPQIRQWRLATRVAFRFGFVYFGLYCLLTQISTSLVPLPNVDVPDLSTFWPMRHVIILTASRVFKVMRPDS